jgi:hypothetical protein
LESFAEYFCRGLVVERLVRSIVVVEVEIFLKIYLSFYYRLIFFEIYFFIFYSSPESFYDIYLCRPY